MGKQRSLKGLGRLTVMLERIRQLVVEIELADKVGLDVYGIGEHHRADFADICARDCSGSWGSQYQEDSFDQCSQHSLKYGSDSDCSNNMPLSMLCQMDERRLWLEEVLSRNLSLVWL